MQICLDVVKTGRLSELHCPRFGGLMLDRNGHMVGRIAVVR